MIDFWLAVALTMLVSVLTILADWAASRLIVAVTTITALRRVSESGLTEEEKAVELERHIGRYQQSQRGSWAWGADLVTVALSLDFAVLGIWIHNNTMFPFFSRFNSENVGREIPIWLVLIGVHLVLLVISLFFRHGHAQVVSLVDTWATFPSPRWFRQNIRALAANAIGFLSLLSTIVVVTNAI